MLNCSVRKILIISISGIGDLILFTPALPLLRKRFKDAEISLLVKKRGAKEVVEDNPYLDRIIVFDPQSASIGELIQFYARMRRYGYDLSLSTFPAMTLLNNLSTWAIGAKDRWVYQSPCSWRSLDFLQNQRLPYQHGQHRIEYNLALVKAITGDLGYEFGDPLDQLYVSLKTRQVKDGAVKDGAEESYPLIGIHAGSGGDQPFKRWEESKFALLADRIMENFRLKVILIGGPGEKELCRRIAKAMVHSPIIAADPQNIQDTLGILSHCRLLISNDSGVMNMALGIHTRIIAVFGPTDDTCTRPLGKGDLVVFKKLPCKPECRARYLYKPGCDFNYRCLRDLSIDEVWEVASPILKSIESIR